MNIRTSVQDLSAYTLKRRDAAIKLNQNESPFDLPQELKAEVLQRMALMPWNRYPDFHPEDVLTALGARHGVPAEGVLIGNGSNELLQAIFLATTGPSAAVALPSPTFTLYHAMAAANDAAISTVLLDAATLQYDQAATLAEAARGDRHVLLCNPNNPTGAALPATFVERALELTEHLIIVDEAYIQFAEEGTACDHLLARHRNLIVLRTLSKAAGLAGVRFGYAVGDPAIMREIGKVKLPYNVGHFGLEVVRALLRHDESLHLTHRVRLLRSERLRVQQALEGLGVQVFPSQANFLMFRHPWHSALFDHLLEHGVLVRDVSHYPLLAGCLRVTIGTPDQNDAFLEGARTFAPPAHEEDRA